MKQRSTDEWRDCLKDVDVPHAPLWDYAALFTHPQAASRNLRVTVQDAQGRPIDLIGTPFHIEGAALPSFACPPTLGADTAQILGELLGIDAVRLAELKNRRTI